jgi:hypothetical protein
MKFLPLRSVPRIWSVSLQLRVRYLLTLETAVTNLVVSVQHVLAS